MIDASGGPVRDDNEEFGAEGGRLAEGLGETEVVTNERCDLPAVHLEDDGLVPRWVMVGLVGEGEGIAFAVASHLRSIGSETDRRIRAEGGILVQRSDPGDDMGSMTDREACEELLGFAAARLGDRTRVHGEARSRKLGQNEE